jgi:hypothetical protein
MGIKQNFTPEEWRQVVESVMLSGIAVSAADPSGLWGMLKEGFASSSALKAAKVDANSNELIRAAPSLKRRREAGAHPTDCVERSLTDAKAPDGAAAFKAWLCTISQKVAAASVLFLVLAAGASVTLRKPLSLISPRA